MTEKEFQVCDGIRLLTTQTNKFKMTRLSFSFIMPADDKLSPQTKLALSCMMRGTGKYPTLTDINRRLDELYDTTIAMRVILDGDRHIFKIYCEMIDECYLPENIDILGGTLDIIKEIFFNYIHDENGLLDEKTFESEKGMACDEIRSKINDPRAYAAERCREIMFEGEKASISCEGKLETVMNLTRNEVSKRASELIESTTIVCSYIGSKEGEIVANLLSDLFKNKKISQSGIPSKSMVHNNISKEIKTCEEKFPVSQGRLQIGFQCNTCMGVSSDFFAMCMFNEIFGGMSTSKLFMNVREKKSLCYYCSSGYMSSKGAIFVSCGIKPDNKDVAYEEIIHQLNEMKAGNITEEEISSAKKSIINSYRQIKDNPIAIEGFSLRKVLNNIYVSIDDCINEVNNVSREDIVKAASKAKVDTVYFLNGTDNFEEVEMDEF